jgi:FkbM family methyltransferase
MPTITRNTPAAPYSLSRNVFVSYAQNFEDIILWRALKHVGRGFYIDIGAQDPMIDSVSLAFYEQGWRGVHVEPTAHYASKIRSARPDEDVVEAAVGAQEGAIPFFEIADTGLSTGDAMIAQRHEADGYVIKRLDVPCLPLSKLLDTHKDRDIHWLKIDVEGMEEQVIASWSPSPVRPWIVVVESTSPNSSEPNFAGWEPQLVALGYEFVYFDGLNRFYTSRDHPELKASFGPGPNFFDDFVLSSQSSHFARSEEVARLNRRIAEMDAWGQAAAAHEAALTQQLAAREAEITELKTNEAALRAEAEQLARDGEADRKASEQALKDSASALALATLELQAVYASRSWKITLPYRGIGWAARGVVAAPKRIARICLEGLSRGAARAAVPGATCAAPSPPGEADLPAAITPTWGIDPDPNALTEWRNIVDSNRQPNTV